MNKNRITLIGLIAALLLLSATLVSPARPAEARSGRQVWVFYMGFWDGPQAWDAHADVLTDHPLMGHYDSRDPGVAGSHIDQARSAGIDAFVVSWFGADDGAITTPVLNNMLDRAAERGFEVGAAVDMMSPVFNQSRDAVVRSLKYLVNDRANHPAYLRYNGKPVIFFAFQGNPGFSTSTWQGIRNEVDPGRATIWIAEGLSGCCLYGGAMDGMYAFNLAWANGSLSRFQTERNAVTGSGGMYIPTVHPGWDEDRIAAKEGRPNPTARRDRQGGQFLATSFQNASSIGSDVILVVSWNEFLEGSHIEPSQLYGTQSLDTLRPLIGAWEAGSSAPAAPPPASGGQTLEAAGTVNVRTGPGTTYAVIGQINPGAQYPVTGQQGDWYMIAYNGQTGYVYGPLVRVSGGAPASSPSAGGQTLEATTTLNVRSGPGTSYAAIGKIYPGTQYPVTGQQGDWYMIAYNGQTGYVYGPLVRLSGGAPAGAPTGQSVEAASTVNVRMGPGTSYAVIGKIYPGTQYPVTGQQGDWYMITYNGQTGYVYGPLVRVSAGAPALPGGALIAFSASPSSIPKGQCAAVSWSVDNVSAIFFQGQGVTGHESRQVCPTATTTYTLDVVLVDGSRVTRQVTVTVY